MAEQMTWMWKVTCDFPLVGLGGKNFWPPPGQPPTITLDDNGLGDQTVPFGRFICSWLFLQGSPMQKILFNIRVI